jgi:hypothetical protein
MLFDNPVLVTHETHTRVVEESCGAVRMALTTRKIG